MAEAEGEAACENVGIRRERERARMEVAKGRITGW
jgi:hypothetical protein